MAQNTKEHFTRICFTEGAPSQVRSTIYMRKFFIHSFILFLFSNCRGDFVRHRKEGKGVMTCANGEIYSGDWVKNLRHGSGVCVWPDKVKYVETMHLDSLRFALRHKDY